MVANEPQSCHVAAPSAEERAAQVEFERKQKEQWEVAQMQAAKCSHHSDDPADHTAAHLPPNLEDYAMPFEHKFEEIAEEKAASTTAGRPGHATKSGTSRSSSTSAWATTVQKRVLKKHNSCESDKGSTQRNLVQDFDAMQDHEQVPMAQEVRAELLLDEAPSEAPPAWGANAWTHIERKIDNSSEKMETLSARQSARMDTLEIRLQAEAERSEHALRRVQAEVEAMRTAKQKDPPTRRPDEEHASQRRHRHEQHRYRRHDRPHQQARDPAEGELAGPDRRHRSLGTHAPRHRRLARV